MSSSNCSRETPSPHPKCSQISLAALARFLPTPGGPELLPPLLLAALEARALREGLQLGGAQALRGTHVQRFEDLVHQLLALQRHAARALAQQLQELGQVALLVAQEGGEALQRDSVTRLPQLLYIKIIKD